MKVPFRLGRPSPVTARALLRRGEYFFFVVGLLAIGCYFFAVLDTYLYQSYLRRSFDASLKNKTELAHARRANPFRPLRAVEPGFPVGCLEIPRLNLSVIVLEGTDEKILYKGAGHIPETAWPGESGNVGISAHRDTFFSDLKNIRKNDEILFTTVSGSYHYVVDQTRVVKPEEVSVLDPSDHPVLTLVTCYPFHYVGSAPKRFIVYARQISSF